jgi:hypothetical protein
VDSLTGDLSGWLRMLSLTLECGWLPWNPTVRRSFSMRRALIGAIVGTACGVLALAVWGAWGGYTHGGEWVARPAIPPGWEAAAMGAFVFTAYYWWLFGAVGAVIGGLAGLGSWVVRPRPAIDPFARRERLQRQRPR